MYFDEDLSGGVLRATKTFIDLADIVAEYNFIDRCSSVLDMLEFEEPSGAWERQLVRIGRSLSIKPDR